MSIPMSIQCPRAVVAVAGSVLAGDLEQELLLPLGQGARGLAGLGVVRHEGRKACFIACGKALRPPVPASLDCVLMRPLRAGRCQQARHRRSEACQDAPRR